MLSVFITYKIQTNNWLIDKTSLFSFNCLKPNIHTIYLINLNDIPKFLGILFKLIKYYINMNMYTYKCLFRYLYR